MTRGTNRNKRRYRALTGFPAFGTAAQGVAEIVHPNGYVVLVARLGYPPCFLNVIGAWKLLGVVAILTPRFALLNERAYAGFFFAMSGAVLSPLANNDKATDLLPPLFLALLTVLSSYFRPPNRRLPVTTDRGRTRGDNVTATTPPFDSPTPKADESNP